MGDLLAGEVLWKAAAFLVAAFFILSVLWAARFWCVERLLKLHPATGGFVVDRAVRVPTSDGFTLATSVYFPAGPGPFPVVVLRSPYGRWLRGGPAGVVNDFFAAMLARRGFAVLLQDVRGRFASSGEWVMLQNERDDGLSTLAWARKQPWCDGKVGTFGQSYMGYTQYAVADGGLDAMVLVQTSAEMASVTHLSGTVGLDTSLRFLSFIELFGSATSPSLLRAIRTLMSMSDDVDRAAMTLPLGRVDDELLGRRIDNWHDALEHPPGSDFWKPWDHRSRVHSAPSATLLVAGWSDMFLDHCLRDFASMRAAGVNARLLIGPWAHGIITGHWLNRALETLDVGLRGARGKEQSPVRFLVLGSDEWRDADAFPPPCDRVDSWFLDAGGALSPTAVGGPTEPTRWRYNPADPTPMVGGPVLDFNLAGPRDNRALEARADVVTFTSPPLASDTDVIGAPAVHVSVQTSAESADVFARLCDVDEHGVSRNITDGLVRITRGNGLDDAGAGEVRVEMWPTAARFRAGHRLRLQLSSGAHPRFSRNLGTREPVHLGTEWVVAEQCVLHDDTHPSRLELPIVGS